MLKKPQWYLWGIAALKLVRFSSIYSGVEDYFRINKVTDLWYIDQDYGFPALQKPASAVFVTVEIPDETGDIQTYAVENLTEEQKIYMEENRDKVKIKAFLYLNPNYENTGAGGLASKINHEGSQHLRNMIAYIEKFRTGKISVEEFTKVNSREFEKEDHLEAGKANSEWRKSSSEISKHLDRDDVSEWVQWNIMQNENERIIEQEQKSEEGEQDK